MHFVICVFISLICLASSILFTEVFPKWFKAAIALLSSFTTGYAISILIRKISMWTGAFAKPALMPVALMAAAATLVVIIIVKIMMKKKA